MSIKLVSTHNSFICCVSDLCWGKADLSEYHLHPFHRTVVGNCWSCLTSHLPQPAELHPCLCSHFPLGHMQLWIQGSQCWGTEKNGPPFTLYNERNIYFRWFRFFSSNEWTWFEYFLFWSVFLRFRSCFRRRMARFSISDPPPAWREETFLRIWSSTRLPKPRRPKRKLVRKK